MEQKARRVLIVDVDKENIGALSEILVAEGHIVTHAGDAESALHRIRAWKPHLVLLEVNIPGMSGVELIPRIRALTTDEYALVVLVSANISFEDVARGIDAGADDYLVRPFSAQDLLVRMRAMTRMKELQDNLRRANHRIDELSTTDDLTGLLNMRAMYRRGEDEIQRARRFRKPLSALVVNLDRFSSVNETAEFQFGSQVLREAGLCIRKCVRGIDLVARVGADEYFVLLVETDLSGAEFVAERIRDSISSTVIKDERHQARLTASIGISGFGPDQAEGTMADLIRNGGDALRSAKAAGANRTEVYSFV